MLKVSDYARVFMTCIAGVFGVRTPPEPEVIPHMSPVKGPEGSDPGSGSDAREGHTAVMPPRNTSGTSTVGYSLDLPTGLDVSFRRAPPSNASEEAPE